MITIKHANYDDREFRDLISVYRDDKLKDIVKDNLDKYKTVASPMLGGSLNDILNDSYRITNSVMEAWYSNEEANPTEEAAQGCRSTSVGDIIIVHGERYLVNGAGFICLEE